MAPIVRLPRLPRPAGRRVPARRDLERRACAQRRRPGVRSACNHVEVPGPGHGLGRAGGRRHVGAGGRSGARRWERSRLAPRATQRFSTSSRANSSSRTRRARASPPTDGSASRGWSSPGSGGPRNEFVVPANAGTQWRASIRRRHRPGTLDDQAVVLGSAVQRKVERRVLVRQREVEIAARDGELVALGGAGGNDFA